VLLRPTFSAFIRVSSQTESDWSAPTADYDFFGPSRGVAVNVPQMNLEKIS